MPLTYDNAYTLLINRVKRLQKLREIDAPQVIIENEKRLILKGVTYVFWPETLEELQDDENYGSDYLHRTGQ